MESLLTILPIITGVIGILQNSGKLYSFWQNNVSKEKVIPKYIEKEFSQEEIKALTQSLILLENSKPILKIIFYKYLYRFAILIVIATFLVIANYFSIEITNKLVFEGYFSSAISSLINYFLCAPFVSNPFKLNFKNAIEKDEIIKELAKPASKLLAADSTSVKLTSKLDQEFLKGYINLTNLVYTLFTYKIQDLIERERRNLTEVSHDKIIEIINFSITKLIEKSILKNRPHESDRDAYLKWKIEQAENIKKELNLTGLEVFVPFFQNNNFLESNFTKIHKEDMKDGIKNEIEKYW